MDRDSDDIDATSRRRSQATSMRLLLAAVVALGAAAMSCGEKERAYVANISDGNHTPTMTTLDVETFISDSGYTRYHLSTPRWQMFEEAAEPFWRFPEGLDLQQYDLAMRPDATMTCDTATYFSRKRLWRLDGHVVMVNTLRDSFLSQQLFWDQAKRLVYTDSFIHIVRSDRIIEGYGFESNENMTAYSINRPTGIIPIERRRPDSAPEAMPADSTDADSVVEAPTQTSRRRPAAPRRVDRPTTSRPTGTPYDISGNTPEALKRSTDQTVTPPRRVTQ